MQCLMYLQLFSADAVKGTPYDFHNEAEPTFNRGITMHYHRDEGSRMRAADNCNWNEIDVGLLWRR